MSKGPLRYAGQVLLLAAAYFLAGKLGLAVTTYAKGNAGLVWPPTGLSLAALLLFGGRLWPGVAIGAFLVNFSTGTPVAGATAVSLGNTVEALVGFLLLRRVARFDEAMCRVRDVVALFFFGFLVATAVGSAVSTLGLFATGYFPATSRFHFGLHWWFGDALSNLLIAPALLVWARRRRLPRSAAEAAEAAAVFGGIVLSSLVVFGGWIPQVQAIHPIAYFVFPFVVGAAMRFGQLGASAANPIAAAIAVLGTAAGHGPFAGGDLNRSVLYLGAFLAILALTSLIVGAETSQRRATAHALRRSEESFRSFMRHTPVVAFIKDAASRYLYLNETWERAFGRRPGEWIGKTVEEVWPAEAAAQIRSGDEELLASGKPQELHRTFQGQEGPRNWMIYQFLLPDPEGGPSRIGGMALDVSRQKRLEDELRVRARQQAVVAELGQLALTEGDFETLLQRVVDAVAQTLGSDFAGVLEIQPDGETLVMKAGWGWDLSRPHALKIDVRSHAGLTLLGGEPVIVEDLGMDPRIAASPLLTEAGIVSGITVLVPTHERPYGVLGAHTRTRRAFSRNDANFLKSVAIVLADAIDRREKEKALERSERHFRSLIENALDIITVVDVGGSSLYQSPSVERVTGRKPDDLLGVSLLELLHPDDLPAARDALRRVSQDPGAVIGPVEVRVLHVDGGWRVLESTGTNLLDIPEIRGIVINSRDITDRKRAEEALRESEERLQQAMKMEAVGRLAGGVAHDFNNMLTAINGHGEMLLDALPAGSPLHRDAEEILRAGKRAADLTRQLLAFSRKQVLQPRSLDLNEIVRGIESMLRRLLGEHIAFVTRPAPGLAPVLADPGQIEQIVLNLAVNARDAMPDGGTIELATANVEIGEERPPDLEELTPGSWVALSVRDTGHGMDAATLARVFEPFFTTKEVGQGTGLGLSTVYGIVKQSGGHVTARSAPGEGALFTVYLPRTTEAEARAEASRESRPRAAGGPETILVVEDERAVRSLVREILETNGYSVLEAGNADEALRAVQAYAGKIDLLLSDVVMPGMSGPSLAVKLRAMRPSIAVLFMSGYAEEPVELRGIVEKGAGFLAKPFTLAALTRKVREVLDARAGRRPGAAPAEEG